MLELEEISEWKSGLKSLKYKYYQKSKVKIKKLLQEHTELKVSTGYRTKVKELCLNGTVQVIYNNSLQDVPIHLWLDCSFPRERPLVFVTPLDKRNLNSMCSYLQTADGQVVGVQYLVRWKAKSCLNKLVSHLIDDYFCKEFPLHPQEKPTETSIGQSDASTHITNNSSSPSKLSLNLKTDMCYLSVNGQPTTYLSPDGACSGSVSPVVGYDTCSISQYTWDFSQRQLHAAVGPRSVSPLPHWPPVETVEPTSASPFNGSISSREGVYYPYDGYFKDINKLNHRPFMVPESVPKLQTVGQCVEAELLELQNLSLKRETIGWSSELSACSTESFTLDESVIEQDTEVVQSTADTNDDSVKQIVERSEVYIAKREVATSVQSSIAINTCVQFSSQLFYRDHAVNAYQMTSRPRGRALIINVQSISGYSPRTGTNIDRDNLRALWEQLHFHVTVYNDGDDLTANGIKDKLVQFAHSEFHRECDCCVVCLLSHGKNESIFGTDGELVPISVILTQFDNNVCHRLRNKPKLFFIQACRGATLDSGVQTDLECDAVCVQQNLMPSSLTDALIGYPTPQGYVSWRDKSQGSWFIQGIVRIFTEFSHKEDLCSMMNMVNSWVSEQIGRTQVSHHAVQMSQYTSILRKPKLFFFPGIFS